MLASGGLSFRLEGKGLKWELAEKLVFEVTQPPDYPIDAQGNGQPVEKSLVRANLEQAFQQLEKDVALYIDDVKAVRWWHRIAVQADWYLDGWKKKRVFPDFLVALEEATGKPSKLVVVETKGLHSRTRTPNTSGSYSRPWNGTATAACRSANYVSTTHQVRCASGSCSKVIGNRRWMQR